MKPFTRVLFCLALLNVCAFTVHDAVLGGSASIGKVENGTYYVSSHGHYTEVSRSTFQFSKWLALSGVVSFFIAFFIGLDGALSKQKRGDYDSSSRNRIIQRLKRRKGRPDA
jgi:hypothetical protein